ncbi:hypothetical protein [Methanobrevibacter sp.]|uniref:hypothetical protein n=1 Tax=Methanobrevibacter sp. TaxID=66852 RepID=UPI00386752E1
MIRLENETQVIYDANVIIYSLFPEKYKIPLLTALAKDLNNFLFNQESTIVVPHFIICEIERKGYYNVIDDYFKDLRQSSKFQLMIELRHNFENLKNHENFSQEYYQPCEELLDSIDNAFIDFNNLDNIGEYFMRKHTDVLNPSIEDKKLILFSKDKECPLISNDLDLTFFYEELLKRNLVHEIIDFTSINFNA